MPNFILIKRSRNALSSVLHVIFNIILGFSGVAITALTGSPIIGIFLVILSKWRMFAVRPHYWLTNFSANSVDLIVGISFILLSLPVSGATADFLPIHALLSLGYILWLTILKPRTSFPATEAQALTAIFLGTNAATLQLFPFHPALAVLTVFLIVYFSVRHILIQNDDPDFNFTALTLAIIAAEIAWISYFWLIVYSFNQFGVFIAQSAFLVTLATFCLGRIYHSHLRHDGRIRSSEVTSPILFTILLTLIMLLLFSKPIFNI